MPAIFHFFAENSVLLLFFFVGMGMFLGHIKIKGIGLGAAGVLFFAIGFSAWSQSYGITFEVPKQLGILGLAIFAFAIGINSGPNFFHVMKASLGPVLTMLVVLIGAGAVAHGVGKYVLGMPPALIAGTFSGAVTNTPALYAAGVSSGDPGLATVGYSISYLFGVLGMMIAALAALAYRRKDTDAPSPLVNRTIRVERDDRPCIGDISASLGDRVSFSRLRRGEDGPILRPTMNDTLDKDDLVTVVGPRRLVAKVVFQLGHHSSHSLIQDRSYLDFRRITVSDPKLAGRSIDELAIEEKFSATISRVRRGDVDMVGEPGLVLQQGDRVRVVAPTSKMPAISDFFGDSARGLSDINPVALGLGMTAGIILGEIPIPLPGGSTFAIGAAAGTLLVGLVFGRIGRVGKVVTALPHTACMVLSEFGLLLFLAQAGSHAGGQILKAFASGAWIEILLLGVIVTSVLAIGLYVTMRWVFHMGGTRLSGLLGGTQTQPAVLAFANTRTNADPRVALGYAMVYPMAMIAKILIAQILGAMA